VLTARGYPRVITEEEYHEFCIYVTPERLARHARIEPVGYCTPPNHTLQTKVLSATALIEQRPTTPPRNLVVFFS
jgi:hypothetical protein